MASAVVEITQVTRWHVRFRYGDRTGVIQGEMLVPTPGMSDFLVYADTLRAWESPHEADLLDDNTKATIRQAVGEQLRLLGWVVEFV